MLNSGTARPDSAARSGLTAKGGLRGPNPNVIRAGPTPDHSFGRLPTTSIHPTPDLLRNALALDPSQVESLVCEPDKSLPARP